MTAKYYVHGKARHMGKGFHDIDFTIKYNDKITIDFFYDFENFCLEYLRENNPKIVQFRLSNWSRFDEE